MKNRLLALLDLPEESKQSLMREGNDLIKARLGDRQAEQRVIEAFENASNLKKPAHSDDLLYIGSEATIHTFLDALESVGPETSSHLHSGNPATVAYRMLVIYQRYDDVGFFDDIDISTTEEEFLRPEYQQVVRSIESHFFDRYGRQVHLQLPYFVGREFSPIETWTVN
ncbi:MAG: hypothetical protein MPN21_28320 [Thermoanaerobaculia bacterium]|nr:hypothetical protein [Thermoanaerobaculia bacterium]